MSKKNIIFFSIESVSIFYLVFISMTYKGAQAGSEPPSAPFDLGYVPGELLVKFAPKADGTQLSKAEKNQIMSFLGEAKVKGNYKIVPGLCHVKLPAGVTVEHAIEHLNTKEGIMYAQPNHYLMLCSIPNDPEFSNLWGMHNNGGGGRTLDADIDAPEAWDIETDAGDIIVAVIDSGVDYNHEDLAANMWINPGEDHPPLGVVGPEDFDGVNDDENYDNEGNPLIDDLYGYDFCSTDNEDGEYGRDPDPMDSHEDGGHGTLMAGVIGAVGNNGIGITGVCWNVKIMALRSFHSNTGYFGLETDAIACIDYAVLMGAKVTSNSWGRYYDGPPYYALANAIASAGENGVLFVAAVNNFGDNVDNKPFYPACYSLSNIISVMATDWDDERSVWGEGSSSNYGAVSVDLAAPGSVIMSCRRGGGYQFANGTSMSTPFVSGACALVWSVNPSLSHLEVKGIVLNTVDVKAQLEDDPDPEIGRTCVTGGRLNLNDAVREAIDFPTDDELVGRWRLNEGEGTIVYDSAGDNDGTLGEAPKDPVWNYDPGRGWCLDFDEDDEVKLSPIVALMLDSVTVSTWVKATNLRFVYQDILTQCKGYDGYRLGLDSGKPRFFLNNQHAVASTGLDIGKWHHLTGTYDGSHLKIYVDGVEGDPEPFPGQNGFYGDAYIGHDMPGFDTSFEGKIDDVRVYNYALDVDEINFVMWDGLFPNTHRFRINNSEDETVAWFDSLGNLFLKGNLEEGKGAEPKETYNDGFKFTNLSGNTILAIIDETNGNMYIRGRLYPEQPMLYPAGFRVLNLYGGSYIDDSVDYYGDLVMTGKLYELNP